MVDRKKLGRLGPGAIALGLLGISMLHYVIPDSERLWHSIVQHLYVLPVVIGAIYYGWKGGLLAASFAVFCLTPHALTTYARGDQVREYLVGQVAEMIDFFVAALVIGLLADRERKQRQTLEHTARQLSAIYRELQDNFERMKRSERLTRSGSCPPALRTRFGILWLASPEQLEFLDASKVQKKSKPNA